MVIEDIEKRIHEKINSTKSNGNSHSLALKKLEKDLQTVLLSCKEANKKRIRGEFGDSFITLEGFLKFFKLI